MSANHCTRHPPTLRQLECLWHIREHQRTHGYPISYRALCAVLGIASTNGANDHAKALIRKGLAAKDEMVARSLRVTDLGARFLRTFTPAAADMAAAAESTGNGTHEVKSDTAALNTGEGAQ